jgi:hypothetical protein
MNKTVIKLYNACKEKLLQKETLFAVGIVISVNLLAAYWVSRVHWVWFYDHITYWRNTIELCDLAKKDIIAAIGRFYLTVQHYEYNQFPSLLLSPVLFIFGYSRMVFTLAIVNIFLIPSAFVLMKTSELFAPREKPIPRPIFLRFLPTLVFLSFPFIVYPVLMGHPDVGGMIPVFIVLYLYFRRPLDKQKISQVIVYGILLAALFVFRRWYGFWIKSFLVLIIGFEIAAFAGKENRQIADLFKNLGKILLMLAVLAAVLLILSAPVVWRALKTDYSEIYSAFRIQNTVIMAFLSLLANVGPVYLILFISGTVFLFISGNNRPFLALLVIQLIFMFIDFNMTQSLSIQHFYLLAPGLVIIISQFLIFCFEKSRILAKKRLRYAFSGVTFFLAIIFSYYVLDPRWLDSINIDPFIKYWLLTKNAPPVRNDLDEIRRLTKTLEKLSTETGGKIYILAGSENINCSMIQCSYLSFNERPTYQNNVLWTNNIDRRDGFPQDFFSAEYVVVTRPTNFHARYVRPEDQRLIEVLDKSIRDPEGLGQYYRKLDYEFTLDSGRDFPDTKVFVYQKFAGVLRYVKDRISAELKSYYPNVPFIYDIR